MNQLSPYTIVLFVIVCTFFMGGDLFSLDEDTHGLPDYPKIDLSSLNTLHEDLKRIKEEADSARKGFERAVKDEEEKSLLREKAEKALTLKKKEVEEVERKINELKKQIQGLQQEDKSAKDEEKEIKRLEQQVEQSPLQKKTSRKSTEKPEITDEGLTPYTM